jgi:hypothetical protein
MNDPSMTDRRSMMARVLWLAGATASFAVMPEALAEAARPKAYLDKPVFDLLSAVADTIVPTTDTAGAIDARVPTLFDALLVTWASGERRYELTQALARIDAKSRETSGKPFAGLSPQQRTDLLSSFDKQALKVLPGKPADAGTDLRAGPNHADRGYAKLKELIVLLYYMSEPALTQELSYVHAPGRWEPSIPVTPQTRPAAGTMF